MNANHNVVYAVFPAATMQCSPSFPAYLDKPDRQLMDYNLKCPIANIDAHETLNALEHPEVVDLQCSQKLRARQLFRK